MAQKVLFLHTAAVGAVLHPTIFPESAYLLRAIKCIIGLSKFRGKFRGSNTDDILCIVCSCCLEQVHAVQLWDGRNVGACKNAGGG